MSTNNPLKFALIGAGGYVAPRHMKAIRDTGNQLVIACDLSDSVGILDSFGYDIGFTTNEREFRYSLNGVDFLSITTPNYLHMYHSIWGLEAGCNVICEKPLALSVIDLNKMKDEERYYSNYHKKPLKVYTVLQLRYHPELLKLREQIQKSGGNHKVNLTYVTARGNWYHRSWKGKPEKSGGLIFNIGIHLLDMLLWIFGDCSSYRINTNPGTDDSKTVMCDLQLEKADVNFILSIDPKHTIEGNRQVREMVIDDEAIVNFTSGFTDLHTVVYQDILAGHGYGIEDVRPAIILAERLSNG